jgi:tetratricopeptide (TPR) repeat protein
MKNPRIESSMLFSSMLLSSFMILHSASTAPAYGKRQSKVPTAAKLPMVEPEECREAIKKASGLFAQGKNTEALSILDQIASRCRNSEKLHLLRSTILLRDGNRMQEAAEAAELAAGINKNSLAAQMQLGVASMAANRNSRAIAAFRQANRIDPACYEAWSALGSLYSSTGQEREAALCSAKASCLEPSSRDARLRAARSLRSAGKIDAMESEYKRLLNDDGLEPEFFLVVAREALTSSALAQAIAAADRVLEAYPDNSEMLEIKAQGLLWSRKYDEVLRLLAGLASPSSTAKAIESLALLQTGNIKEARKKAQEVAAGNEATSLVNLALGMIAARQGKSEDATKHLRASLSDDQLFAPAHIELARHYLQIENAEKSIEEAREIKRNKRYQSTARAMEARAALLSAPDREKMELSVKLSSEAMRLDEKDPEALIASSQCELKKGNIAVAKEQAMKALEIEPGNIDAHLALIESSSSDQGSSKNDANLDKALALAPANPAVLKSVVNSAMDSGELDKGQKALSQALKLNPDEAVLLYCQARLAQKRGDDKAAARALRLGLTRGLSGKIEKEARQTLQELDKVGAVNKSL